MSQIFSLNGDWEFCPLADSNPPARLPSVLIPEVVPFRVPSSWRWVMDDRFDFQPYDLFDYPSHWNDVPAAFLRRRFWLDIEPGEFVRLTFEGVLQRWMMFVNGALLEPETGGGAVVVESFLPVSFDITRQVHSGENEILVWCGEWEHIATPAGEKLLNPNGSWFAGLARGIWQDVWVESFPPVFIDEMAVRSSIRQGKASAEITAHNTTHQSVQVTLAASIYAGDENVRSFPPLSVALAPGEVRTCPLLMDWPDAERWSPENPHLYELRAALSGSSGDISEAHARFGFREVWFDGPNFYLNGVRINLRGDAWHYQGFAYQTREYARNWFAAVRSAGMNFVRLHAQPYPRFFLEVADEMGMLIVDESAIYGSSKNTQSDHPTFLANCYAHLQRLVRRDRNHPSIILWSMQNEMRWVDGRDGYREAIPGLTAAMRTLDPTRSIIYDGDKRLVPLEWCDALSLHYNIDGTVDEWLASSPASRRLPLLFGEHGAFHYVSPQVSADLAGQAAYLRFEDAIASIGQNEGLFIQYARRKGVTGLTPFNLVNYSHWTLPPDHRSSLPNYRPAVPRPNPAYAPFAEACQPITIMPDELNTVFYIGPVRRSFSVYNDTESAIQARLVWTLASDDRVLDHGQWQFRHEPGERVAVEGMFDLPAGVSTLTMDLYHEEHPVFNRVFTYRACPQPVPVNALTGARIAYYGDDAGFERLSRLAPAATRLAEVSQAALEKVNLLVLGEHLRLDARQIAPILDVFVRAGGALLVLEQDQLTFGELTLSERKFFSAHPNPLDHPAFTGFLDSDLRFWAPDNPHSDTWRGLVRNAFVKPKEGDLHILLECAEGSFGWGGLQWAALVSYRLGQGQAVFCQVAISEFFDTVPQAARLLKNLLAWLSAPEPRPATEPVRTAILDASVLELARAGETLLLPPLEPSDADRLGALLGRNVRIMDAPVYQLAVAGQPSPLHPFYGVSASDLFGMERVTYTPRTYQNRLLAQHSIEIPEAEPLLVDVHNPWTDWFVNGMDGEWIKMAVATVSHDLAASFMPRVYAARLPLGKGALVFCQLSAEPDLPRSQRVHSRLLANLGERVDCNLFLHFPPASERGIAAFMGLAHQPHQDVAAMRTYFASPDYTLNNLGEGVFGWMLRLEQRDGIITIPESAGQTWFLTVFLESEINRDPSKRESGTLPDPSIIPDLWLESNAVTTVILNGHTLLEETVLPEGGVNAGDAVLWQGINRLVLILQGGTEEVRLRAWLLTKQGDSVSGFKTILTLD